MLPAQSLMQLAVEGLLKRHLLFSLKNSPPEISLVNKAEKVNYSSTNTVNDKNLLSGRNFHGSHGFSTNCKRFSYNFISTILSAIIYAKNCFCSCQKQNCESSLHFD